MGADLQRDLLALADEITGLPISDLAVIGLDESPLRTACAEASRDGSSVEVANLNSPGQLIVSGARDALDRLSDLAKAAGARRVLPLKVGGAFHSVYMRPAASTLRAA